MAVDHVKMIFQTPNKGLTCFKHYKFLIFDEKKLVYFSGSLNMTILALKVISDPLKYTSLIQCLVFKGIVKGPESKIWPQ